MIIWVEAREGDPIQTCSNLRPANMSFRIYKLYLQKSTLTIITYSIALVLDNMSQYDTSINVRILQFLTTVSKYTKDEMAGLYTYLSTRIDKDKDITHDDLASRMLRSRFAGLIVLMKVRSVGMNLRDLDEVSYNSRYIELVDIVNAAEKDDAE